MKNLAVNKRARYDYEIGDTLEAGLVLYGPEVKSIKLGQASLKGSFIKLKDGEAYLHNAHITPYKPANTASLDPDRPIKLLLHRKQIDKLGDQRQVGSVAVAMALRATRGLIKLEVGIGKPKKLHDKRESLKKAQQEREINRRLS